MRATQFAEIIRDALVAHAVRPIVANHRLTIEHTTKALRECHVLRPETIARIVFYSFPELGRTPLQTHCPPARDLHLSLLPAD